MKKVSFTRKCALAVIARSAATWQSMPAPAVALNWNVGLVGSGFLGSDPNSGQGLRAGQQRLTDFGSDPNNPGSFSPCAPAVVVSNCVVQIDRDSYVFYFGPSLTPALSRPAGRERELIPHLAACLKRRSTRSKSTLKN